MTHLPPSRRRLYALLMSALLVLPAASALAQKAKTASCCAKPTQVFAAMAANPAFVRNHEAPRPFRYQGDGELITFPVAGGTEGRGFLIKSPTKSDKWLFVIQEWWGLNDYIKREAARYARELPGVNVLAVDLYDGAVTADPAEASRLVQTVQPARCEALLKGAATYAGPKARIGSIGWCFGGGWSLQTALMNGKQAAGCVMYYGMPETDPKKLATLQTPVLGIFATQDKHITPEVVKNFEQAMKKAGKQLTVKNYDADHAFANPSNPKYAEQYANDAAKRAVAFLKQTLAVK